MTEDGAARHQKPRHSVTALPAGSLRPSGALQPSRRRLANRCIALLILATAASAAVVPGRAAAQSCPDVEVVFARGTGEPPGVGQVGQAFSDALSARLGGRAVAIYAVNYPASYNFFSTADAAVDAAAHIAAMAQQCPDTEMVLGGYSQGAAAVAMLAGVAPLGGTVGDLDSATPLPAASADRVAAVAVFGNPSARFGTPLSTTGLFAGRAVDVCTIGDPICSAAGTERSAHSAYDSPDYTGQAAGYVAARV